MSEHAMQIQPPHGFIVLDGKYILVHVIYVGPNPNAPTPNWAYQDAIADVLCDLGNAIGALPIPTDAVSVSMPDEAYIRCVIRQRYFNVDNMEADIHNDIVPSAVVKFVVDGDL